MNWEGNSKQKSCVRKRNVCSVDASFVSSVWLCFFFFVISFSTFKTNTSTSRRHTVKWIYFPSLCFFPTINDIEKGKYTKTKCTMRYFYLKASNSPAIVCCLPSHCSLSYRRRFHFRADSLLLSRWCLKTQRFTRSICIHGRTYIHSAPHVYLITFGTLRLPLSLPLLFPMENLDERARCEWEHCTQKVWNINQMLCIMHGNLLKW